MQWDDSPHAGFSTGVPWLPVNPNCRQINAAAALADPESVFHHYRALIELRHNEPAVVHGDFTMLVPQDPQVYAFTRQWDDGSLLVVANFSPMPATFEVRDPDAWQRSTLILTNVAGAEESALNGWIALKPWEARVYRRATES
jgi:oligo-1,6-glucosidase